MKLQNNAASTGISIKAVNEKQTKKKAFRLNKLSVCLGSALYTASAFGVPSGHVVSQGSASFDIQGSQLNITNSNGTVINWQDFSIANGEAVNQTLPQADTTLKAIAARSKTVVTSPQPKAVKWYLLHQRLKIQA